MTQKRFWVAFAYSYRAGALSGKKAKGHCHHRHRTARTAEACAKSQPKKLGPRVYRYWRACEITAIRVTKELK